MQPLGMVFNAAIIWMGSMIITLSSYSQLNTPFRNLKGPVKSFDENTYLYNEGVASEQSHDYNKYSLLDSSLQYEHIYFNEYEWIIEMISIDKLGKNVSAIIYKSPSPDYVLNDLDLIGHKQWIGSNSDSICRYLETNRSKDTVEYIIYKIDSSTKNIEKAITEDGLLKGTVKSFHYADTIKRTDVKQKGVYGKENYTTIETFNANSDVIKKETVSHGKVFISEYTYTYDNHGNWTRMECISSSMKINSKSQIPKDKRKAYFVERNIHYYQ